MEIGQEVNDKEYGEGIIKTIFDNDLFHVQFENKELLVMYGKDLKRYNSKNKLILKTNQEITTDPSNYKELNKLFSQDIYPDIDISSLKVEDLEVFFENSSLNFNESKDAIERTITSVKKGRRYGAYYLTSLGSSLFRKIMMEYVHLRNRLYVPSMIDTHHIKYIYLANKYPDNEIYNNLEVIIPIYDAPLYSWINIETNKLNLKAFYYAEYKDIEISDYIKVKFKILDDDLKNKIDRIGVSLKDNMKDIYTKDGYFILKGSEINIFVGTSRNYIDFKRDLDDT